METIVGKVIERLTPLALDELGLLWNLKDDFKRMKNTVSAIKAKILDAEVKASNHLVSDWLEKLKDVLFDADDLLDDFSTKALRMKVMTGNKMAKEVKLFFSDSNQIAYGLKMGHKMKEIKKRLDDIYNDMIQLQLTDHPMETRVTDREERQSYSFVAEGYVIGREEEKKLVLSYFLDTNVLDEVSIISIVGIGGLGKTALAQLVYNDEAVQKYFDPKMWVCVSEEFSVRQIAQKMLGQTTKCEMEQLQQDLRNKIQGKKFLLVLDDMWNEDCESWLKLKSLFSEGAKGSMIIVTTRSEAVAKMMRTHELLVLEGLDEDKSWQLFSQVAFSEGKEPNDPFLVTIGKEIVKKCVGVPLAIRTIGSLLYCQNPTVDDWLYFKDIELAKIDHQDNKLFAVLKLSYDHLGSNLKSCFAFCSLFPKDFEIERETLIQLWIAQGFIPSSNQTRHLEHVGNQYFMNLLSRSFFQDVKRGKCGDINTCKMHDLMHDLAMLVAKNEYLAIGEGKRENSGDKLRHLSFDFTFEPNWELPTFLFKQKKLRTLMFHFRESGLSSLISTLKCLRVLDVHDSGLRTIPRSIGKLRHLRYLDFSYNDEIQKLPKSITELHNLQTLKLSGCKELKELPRGINKLVSLRHLELDKCTNISWMPHGLGQLTCLQTLTRFVLDHQMTGSVRISELSGLSNLRGKLRIEGLHHLRGNTAEVESAKVFLEKQCFLELELVWTYNNKDTEFEDEMILQGGKLHHTIKRLYIERFCNKSLPDSIGNLLSLQNLEIWDCKNLTLLPDSIGNLSSLQNLDIKECDSLTLLPASIGNLSSLQKIIIWHCHCLTLLPDSIGNLSSLQRIEIKHCDCLTLLPASTGNLSSLQKIEISNCNCLASLPDSIGNLTSLQQLSIEYCCCLASLPDSIGNLSSLQKIEIKHCDCLTSLPSSIGSLSSLQQLAVEYCHCLTSLPDSIGNLSSLQKIEIKHCDCLRLLPGSIGSLSLLQQLAIEYCRCLTSLPDSIGNLSSLRQVAIEYCLCLASLPDSIGNLSSLQEIEIWNCDSLTSLPDSIGNISSLQKIEVKHCDCLTTLPSSIGNLSSLQKIEIWNCDGLTSLPDSIGNLSSLHQLAIGLCASLTSLPDSIRNLSSLQLLETRSCSRLR